MVCMSVVAIIGALLMIALTNVVAGMFPVSFSGDAQLAVWLVSLMLGLATYVTLKQKMAVTGY